MKNCRHCQKVFPTLLDLLLHTKSQHSDENHSVVLDEVKKKFEEDPNLLEIKSEEIENPIEIKSEPEEIQNPLEESNEIKTLVPGVVLIPLRITTKLSMTNSESILENLQRKVSFLKI